MKDIIDYPVNLGLNLVSNPDNNINIDSLISGMITINNYNIDFPVINYFDLYFVDDLYGNNKYYLTSISTSSMKPEERLLLLKQNGCFRFHFCYLMEKKIKVNNKKK